MKKSELLNGLQEEYQKWKALLDQIGPARMDLPGVTGHWSIKDIVAHLTGWRRRTVARLQAAQRGELEPPPPWPANLQTDDEINAWIYEANHERSVGEVLDESHQVFQQLLTAVEGSPDTPENYHKVSYDLAVENGSTQLTITQDNNSSEEEQEQNAKFWKMVLDGIKKLLEG